MIKVHTSTNVRMRKALERLHASTKLWYRAGVRDSFCECHLSSHKTDMN